MLAVVKLQLVAVSRLPAASVSAPDRLTVYLVRVRSGLAGMSEAVRPALS